MTSAALEHLAHLKRYFGIRSTTAMLTFLIGDAVNRLNAQPIQPFVLPSPDVDEQGDDELDTQRFGQQVAQQNRIDRQRAESK